MKNTLNLAEPFEALKNQKQTLNLQRNSTELYECRGRIQGHYSLFIPRNSMLADQIVEAVHIRTLHGGENVIMTEVQKRPKRIMDTHLRSLTKRVRKVCYGCKRF